MNFSFIAQNWEHISYSVGIIAVANINGGLGQLDHVVVVSVLLEELDDLQEVEDREAIRVDVGLAVRAEELRDEEGILVHAAHPAHGLNHPVHGLLRLAHVQEGRPQKELSGMTVPVAPGAQEAHVFLDLHVLAGREEELLEVGDGAARPQELGGDVDQGHEHRVPGGRRVRVRGQQPTRFRATGTAEEEL